MTTPQPPKRRICHSDAEIVAAAREDGARLDANPPLSLLRRLAAIQAAAQHTQDHRPGAA